jgi:hypothetical protein
MMRKGVVEKELGNALHKFSLIYMTIDLNILRAVQRSQTHSYIICTEISKVIFVLAKRTRAHLMTNYLSANRNISLMASKHVTNHNSVN